jgi:predicted aspartyl protease
MPETKEAPRLTRNPDDCMGEIRAAMQLENADDRAVFERGYAGEDEIRTVETEGVVDTGSRPGLVIPRGLADRLGVRTQHTTEVGYADGRTATLDVVGPINVTIEERTMVVDAFVLPEDGVPLIGQIVLERLDLRADCAEQRLVVPPESPDGPVLPIR